MLVTLLTLGLVLVYLLYLLVQNEGFTQNYYDVSVPGLKFLQSARESPQDYRASRQHTTTTMDEGFAPVSGKEYRGVYLEPPLDASPAQFKDQKTDLSKHFRFKRPKKAYQVRSKANYEDDVHWEYPTHKESVMNGGQFMDGIVGVRH